MKSRDRGTPYRDWKNSHTPSWSIGELYEAAAGEFLGVTFGSASIATSNVLQEPIVDFFDPRSPATDDGMFSDAIKPRR